MTLEPLSGPFRLPASPARSDLIAKYFRGFGEPLRIRILQQLRGGGLSVGELADRLGVSQPKVSNHFACLRWCGFVDAERRHRTVLNRIADPRVSEILDLAEALLAEHADHVAACCRIDQAD
jgi:ArsR family transcriptional regulator, cadmium/lead-responsive transcriptional repressor